MSKLAALEPGKSYFIARCPVTGDILDTIPDLGTGNVRRSGNWVVDCASCGTHQLDLSAVEPEKWRAP